MDICASFGAGSFHQRVDKLEASCTDFDTYTAQQFADPAGILNTYEPGGTLVTRQISSGIAV